ncbi:hypothetical protein BB2000_1545 [Proteus mirabilis BB2000]|nr:hypothetical protein BB2000_1545 [Proteus mirabilis BB2000]
MDLIDPVLIFYYPENGSNRNMMTIIGEVKE